MIDRQTIERINEAANIVDVVSEFVTLRRSGANYKGLCPFHDEKTPSFYVSPARGMCHCFGCGKGGNPVSFIMEHEQMTYVEALRWLANKYHIEIHERQLSDDERREQGERESMMAINEWAAQYFQDTLSNTPDGVAIGMQYFRSRGFRNDTIRKFRLGYALNDRQAMSQAAVKGGYKEDFLYKTGLSFADSKGSPVDRFAGRVIFPWIGVSGKVVGFGGRLLDARTKGVNQKYVNSPDSEIYHKDRELYGIYHAKKAIAREDRVYMVEGYTDVISMHQCGIENVVANSGTALSLHQIRMLHRFTSNITLLYDGDSAGIHAALRGTDMLLAEGMNLKVLLLPDGEDPDSFSRKHTAADFRQYVEERQTDFIEFKTDLLLKGQRDPLKRSEAVNSIIRSVAYVTNPILRDTYIHDCAARTGINENTLISTLNSFIRADKGNGTRAAETPKDSTPAIHNATNEVTARHEAANETSKVETMLAQMIVRHGETVIFNNVECEDGSTIDLNVAQYIDYNLGVDGIRLDCDTYATMLKECVEHSGDEDFNATRLLINHQNIEVSKAAAQLSLDPYNIIMEQKARQEAEQPRNEEDRLLMEQNRTDKIRQDTDHLLNDLRMDRLTRQINRLKADIAAAANDPQRLTTLMQEYKQVHELRGKLARLLGNNVIA